MQLHSIIDNVYDIVENEYFSTRNMNIFCRIMNDLLSIPHENANLSNMESSVSRVCPNEILGGDTDDFWNIEMRK